MTINDFVFFLDRHDMINKNNIPNDDDEGFSTRLRIQKYVFLSKYFGLEFPYRFSMHLHGPYSKSLTHDYYQIPVSGNAESIVRGLNESSFLDLVNGKSDDWLEIAATILHKKGTIDDDVLLDHVAWIKCDFSGEFIEDVFSDLQCSILQ